MVIVLLHFQKAVAGALKEFPISGPLPSPDQLLLATWLHGHVRSITSQEHYEKADSGH